MSMRTLSISAYEKKEHSPRSVVHAFALFVFLLKCPN